MKLCLIVDESHIVRKVTKALLNRIGYDVLEAEDGWQAIEHCKIRMPDTILLDSYLPTEMSTHDFLETFARTFRSKSSHIVYATTDLDPVEISRAMAAGADDYILKPYDRAAIEEKFLALPVTV